MTELIEYIVSHTDRGECQCGKCADKLPDREPSGHSIDVHFFWVQIKNDPKAAELRTLLESQYPDIGRLRCGPSYIEIGGALGSQQVALLLIGLGGLLNLWEVITPKTIGISGPEAATLAGQGFVMAGGLSAEVKQ